MKKILFFVTVFLATVLVAKPQDSSSNKPIVKIDTAGFSKNNFIKLEVFDLKIKIIKKEKVSFLKKWILPQKGEFASLATSFFAGSSSAMQDGVRNLAIFGNGYGYWESNGWKRLYENHSQINGYDSWFVANITPYTRDAWHLFGLTERLAQGVSVFLAFKIHFLPKKQGGGLTLNLQNSNPGFLIKTLMAQSVGYTGTYHLLLAIKE